MTDELKAPQRIWLQVTDDYDEPHDDPIYSTWSAEQIRDADIEYTRADSAELTALRDENKRLRAVLLSAYGCICAIQHIGNTDRNLIQAEIDMIKHALEAKP